MRITAALLGASSETQRDDELGDLLRWGIAQYHPVEVISNRVYGLAETGYGRPPVRLVPVAPVVRTVRVDRALVERVVASTALALPVKQGQQVGVVRVYANGRLIARAPLVAAASVPAVGVSGKIQWYARRTAHHLLGLVT